MSSKIRFQITRLILPACLLVFTISILSFAKKNGVVVSSTTKKFSGEDIFKGVFFNTGNAYNLLPSLNRTTIFNVNSLSKEQILEKQEIVNDFVSNIKKLNSDFFARFESAIKSDDYNKISDALSESSDAIMQAGIHSDKYGQYFKSAMNLVKEVNVDEFNLSDPAGREKFKEYIKMKQQQGNGPAIDQTNGACILAVIVAVETLFFINSVAVSTVLAATIAIAAVTAVVKVATRYAPKEGTMSREQLVVELAQNFY